MKKDTMKKDTMKYGMEAISEISEISEVSEITNSTSTARTSGSFADRFVSGLKSTPGSFLQHAKDGAKKSLNTAKHIMKKESNEGGGNYGSLDSTQSKESNAGFQLAQQRPKKVADSWFRRDFSFRATFAPYGANGREGTERRRGIMERLLGPTDRNFSDMINEKGGLGLEYNSVDRGIVDTAVWHRRKVSLIQDEAGKSGASSGGTVDRRSTMLNANIFQDDDEGYVYDHEAVKRLNRERGQLEYALVVVTGFIMAVIGIAVSHSADNILEMKLDSALEVREREISSYDRALIVSWRHLLITFCRSPCSGLKLMGTGTAALSSM
jgi:hypothetical protein